MSDCNLYVIRMHCLRKARLVHCIICKAVGARANQIKQANVDPRITSLEPQILL